MIAEVALNDILNPPIEEDVEELDEFDAELIDSYSQQEKDIDYIDTRQSRGFKQGPVIIIEDKNINLSKRPGYITIDLDRREEPSAAHETFQNDKGEGLDLEDDCHIPSQY